VSRRDVPRRHDHGVALRSHPHARLRELYDESSVEAAAKRDQALAQLFARSGWTQEELARKESKTQQWVAYRIRFGRFLHFITAVIKTDSLPANLKDELAKKEGKSQRWISYRLLFGRFLNFSTTVLNAESILPAFSTPSSARAYRRRTPPIGRASM
jgi:hypothetical protein